MNDTTLLPIPACNTCDDEKKMMHQLDRIAVDECHRILDSTEKWRPKVRRLCEMIEKDCQIVYLSTYILVSTRVWCTAELPIPLQHS